MIIAEAHIITPTARCPDCGQASDRVHSRYIRHPKDLPCAGIPVQWHLQVRRFRCLNADCPRQLFTERLPGLLHPSARRTDRLTEALSRVTLALGGQAGARLDLHLGLCASPRTMLRTVQHVSTPPVTSPRVVGLDEWAWRKGRRYGTIVVDLERHRVLELLPDRDRDSIVGWLQAHPTIEVIARDRSGPFAAAATEGAPAAVQVADRWHLLKNAGEVLQQVFERHRPLLKSAREAARLCSGPEPAAGPMEVVIPAPEAAQVVCTERQAWRQARYDEVHRLHAVGLSKRAIARRVGVSRKTVTSWLRGAAYPVHPGYKRRGRPPGSKLDPYKPYLVERLEAGCENVSALWREIQGQGFTGSRSLVSRFVVSRRRSGDVPAATKRRREPTYSLPDLMYIVLRQEADRTEAQREAIARLERAEAPIPLACELTREFAAMVRDRRVEDLGDWLDRAAGSGLQEFSTFVRGLRRDEGAVRAALSLEWSNGQTEGQVHRLKLIKRSMYGRAGFGLLRQRVLHAA